MSFNIKSHNLPLQSLPTSGRPGQGAQHLQVIISSSITWNLQGCLRPQGGCENQVIYQVTGTQKQMLHKFRPIQMRVSLAPGPYPSTLVTLPLAGLAAFILVSWLSSLW